MTLDDIWTQNGDGRYVNLVHVRNRYRYNPKTFPKGTCFVKSAERAMFEAIPSGPPKEFKINA